MTQARIQPPSPEAQRSAPVNIESKPRAKAICAPAAFGGTETRVAATSSRELLSFRRAFALLLVLVVLPSVALSGFGVLAIVNERTLVEKRLEALSRTRLSALSASLPSRLEKASEPLFEGPVAAPGSVRFFLQDGEIASADLELKSALEGIRSELERMPGRPTVFSVSLSRGATILAARRQAQRVEGVSLAQPVLERVIRELAGEVLPAGEPWRFEIRPVKRPAPEGLVGKLVSGVAEARQAAMAPAELEQVLPAPLQDFSLAAVPVGEDPVAHASTRNRVILGTLLVLLLLTLAGGIIYTSRTLYREARLSRLKTDFVSLVSHELRTPLTSIRMFIETLSLGRVKDPLQTQEVLELLAKETARLSGMIENVLDWARIESGRKRYQRELTPVSKLVESATAAFRAQRLHAPIELFCEVVPNLPCVEVDAEAVAGALVNLLQNAFKYTGDNKRICLRTRADSFGVAIDVEDNGVGIAPKDRKRIFDRFYRADNLLTRKTEGTGLGLAIAKRIVEAQGGRLSVRSELGKGSCFTVHLPPAKERGAP